MHFYDYLILIPCCLTIIWLIIVRIWRITCFFKKTCTWKKCPYRHNYHSSIHPGWLEIGCDKFPPTEEELEEEEKMFDQLDALIEQLSKENRSKHE